MGFMKLVTGHERLVTNHDQKLNFSKTGHQTSQLVTKHAGHGHKRKLYNLAFDDPHLMDYQIDYKTVVYK